jgi:Na+-driven multidrug efflux pump
MKENSNQSIAINSIVMYVRLIIVSVCGLLYTRFALQALGVVDYGMVVLVGGMVALMAVSNSIMISVSNRFMSIAIGKGDIEEANKTFNVNLVIHFLIAILTVLLAIPFGHWYIANYVNYAGRMQDVYLVCDISIIASAISFIGVPYNGLQLARERFFVYCSTDVGAALLKLVITWLLIDHWENKILIYALTMAVMTAYPTVVFILYCKHHFPDIVRFRLVREIKAYWKVLNFSFGVGIGTAMAMVKSQGVQLITNAFFNTTINSAIAVANVVNQFIQMFAFNISKSIAPQIYKSYATNDEDRYTYLVCLSSRLTFMVMLMVALPFLLIPETLFGIWLKEIPEGALLFSRLMIIDLLIISLNSGITDIIFASGKIYTYQIIVSTLVGLAVVTGYFAVKMGFGSESLIYCYILFSFITFLIRPIILLHEIRFKIIRLIKDSYIPVFLISLLIAPTFLFRHHLNAWILLISAMFWYMAVVWLAGLNRHEREAIIHKIREKL